MMKRVQLIIAYDGTNYCGWQVQPNGVTVEEVLNRCLSELLNEEIHVIGASRTDSGVHALGNVAVFDTQTKIPPEKLSFALNQRLPEDIRIQASFETEPDFHPRRCNNTKAYEYRILNRTFSLPCERLYSYFIYLPLDVEAMRKAADYLVGEHDFRSFCSSRSQAEDTYRTIYSLDVEKEGERIFIRISGNGFLYNMVRIIAGTLIKVGLHVYPPSHVQEILFAKDRDAAGPKAPAVGLTLVGIEYKTELQDSICVKNEEGSYLLWQKEITENGSAYLEIEHYNKELLSGLLERTARQAMRDGASVLYARVPKNLMDNRLQTGEFVFESCDQMPETAHAKMWEKCLTHTDEYYIILKCGVMRREILDPKPR